MKWAAPKLWQQGGRCFILAGGASVLQQFKIPEELIIEVISGKRKVSAYSPFIAPYLAQERVIAVNNAYLLGDWMDALFFGDCSWYLVHRKQIIDWPGIKVTSCARFANKPKEKCEGIKYLARDRSAGKKGISNHPRSIRWNGNSGAAAISLAYLFGATQIILLGFDMTATKLSNGMTITHWHGSHQPPGSQPKKNPPFARHLKGFPQIAVDAKALGIEIINANPKSEVKEFKKVSLSTILPIGEGEVK